MVSGGAAHRQVLYELLAQVVVNAVHLVPLSGSCSAPRSSCAKDSLSLPKGFIHDHPCPSGGAGRCFGSTPSHCREYRGWDGQVEYPVGFLSVPAHCCNALAERLLRPFENQKQVNDTRA